MTEMLGRLAADRALEEEALVHEALGLDDKGIHLAEPRSNIPRY